MKSVAYETSRTQPRDLKRVIKTGLAGGAIGVGTVLYGAMSAASQEPVSPAISEARLEEATAEKAQNLHQLDAIQASVGKACIEQVKSHYADVPPVQHISRIYDGYSYDGLSSYDIESIEYEYLEAASAAEDAVVQTEACDTGRNDVGYNITTAHEALFDVELANEAIADIEGDLDRYRQWEDSLDVFDPYNIALVVGSCAVLPALAAGVYGPRKDQNQ